MSFIFINARCEYLSTSIVKEVRIYRWRKTLEKAEVFADCSVAQFSIAKCGSIPWKGRNAPYKYILGIARVNVVRTVTIAEVRGI